jgi:hypothetical protein
MDSYCEWALLLTVAINHIINYFSPSRLTVASLMGLVLLNYTTDSPADRRKLLRRYLYSAGHGIAFVYSYFRAGIVDGAEQYGSTESRRDKKAIQDAILQARNEIMIRLPELVNLAKEHATSSQDKSSLDKTPSRIEKSLDDLLELTYFHLADLYADTNHGGSESGHDASSSSNNAKSERADTTPTKSPQTLANKSADAARWFQSKGSAGPVPGFPVQCSGYGAKAGWKWG